MSHPFQQGGVQDPSSSEPTHRLMCKVCERLFTDPLLLPCLHTLCRGCVPPVTREGCVRCPSCGERAEGDLSEAIPNRLAGRLVEEMRAQERVKEMRQKLEKQESISCQSCGNEGQGVEGFCQDCSLSICGRCIGHHSLLPINRNHKIVPLAAMSCLQATSSEEPSPAHCPFHGAYVLDLYCANPSCLAPIRFKCTVSWHKGHEDIPIEDVDMEKQTSWLKLFADTTQSSISVTERGNDQMQQSISLLDAHCTEAHQKVRKCMDQLRKAVDEREHRLHEQINVVQARRVETVRAQQSTNTSLLNRLQHAKDTAEEVWEGWTFFPLPLPLLHPYMSCPSSSPLSIDKVWE